MDGEGTKRGRKIKEETNRLEDWRRLEEGGEGTRKGRRMERHRIPSSQALTILKPMELQRKAAKPRRKESERTLSVEQKDPRSRPFSVPPAPVSVAKAPLGPAAPSRGFAPSRSAQGQRQLWILSALEGGQGAEGAATVAIAE